MSYFEHPHLSNSKLTQFGAELGVLDNFESTPEQTFENFRFGTLFDAYETEPETIDYLNYRVIGTEYSFDDNDIKKIKIMSNRLHNDSTYENLMALNPIFQKEIYDDNFSLDGDNVVGFKAKLDLFLPGLVIDLKTTSATSQSQFECTCEMFGYFRQMLLYMNLTGAKKSLIIGVSKKNHKVFKVHFDESHKMYDETLAMCKLLIFKYVFLK